MEVMYIYRCFDEFGCSASTLEASFLGGEDV